MVRAGMLIRDLIAHPLMHCKPMTEIEWQRLVRRSQRRTVKQMNALSQTKRGNAEWQALG